MILLKMNTLLLSAYKLLETKLANQTPQNKVWFRHLYISTVKLYYYTEDKSELENETQSTNYVNTESEYGFGRRYAIRKLQQLFKVTHFVAHNIAMQNRQLWQVHGKLMSDNYKLCKEEDVSDKILLRFPTILAQKDLEEKINILKQLWLPVSTTIPLVTLNTKRFKAFTGSNSQKFINRIKFFARLCELPEVEICMIFTKKTFLWNLDLEKAEKNYKLILDYGISREELNNDLWALRYNSNIINNRLQIAKKANLEKLKTWMVRANEQIFHAYIKRRTENKKILGESSVTDYLAERLQCTPEQVQVIIKKHPALQNKNMPKLKGVIDYLYSEGFQPFQIVRAPKILLHSIETTKKRLDELQQKGLKVDSLYILTKSQKQYNLYFESLAKIKAKNS